MVSAAASVPQHHQEVMILVAELIHETLVKLSQVGHNCRNLVLLGQYCAPEMPSSRYLSHKVSILVRDGK